MVRAARKPRPVPFAPLLAGLLAALASCEARISSEEVRYRHDAEADTLEVALIYGGIELPEEKAGALDKGAR